MIKRLVFLMAVLSFKSVVMAEEDECDNYSPVDPTDHIGKELLPSDDLSMLLGFETIIFITMYKGNEEEKKSFEKFYDVFMTIAKKYSTPDMHEMVGSTHWFKTDIEKYPEME